MQHIRGFSVPKLRKCVLRADSIGTNSGFMKARGYIDFSTIDIITASPNPFNTTQGGLGLLPWYIHP